MKKENTFQDEILKNKELLILIILATIISILATIFILITFEPRIDYIKDFEKLSEYSWTSFNYLNKPVYSEGDYRLVAEWEEEEYFILQLLDGNSMIPVSSENLHLVELNSNDKKIQFDTLMTFPKNSRVTVSIYQYDTNSLIESASVSSNLVAPMRSKGDFPTVPFSISAQKHEDAVSYKIFISVNQLEEPGKIILENMDLLVG